MTEHNHNDNHEHPPDPAGELHVSTRPPDPAGQSLADALRVSFRLLTVIMVIVAILFFLTGVKSIDPQQVGIKKVFGRVVGTAGPGLAITWPFPIGEIEIVDVKEQTITIEDFYMHETAADKAKDGLSDRRPAGEGLRPGWDGIVFSGDRNLLHVKLICNYRIQDPVAYMQYVGELTDKQQRRRVEETVRAVVCRAVIAAAGRRTADAIMRTEKDKFSKDIRADAQAQLNVLLMYGPRAARYQVDEVLARVSDPEDRARATVALRSLRDRSASGTAEEIDALREKVLALVGAGDRGAVAARLDELTEALGRTAAPIRISRINVSKANWPLRALPAYQAYHRATLDKDKVQVEAIAEARQTLMEAAGAGYAKLVGEPWQSRGSSKKVAGDSDDAAGAEDNLIGQYIRAREAGESSKAAELLRKIDDVLVSRATKGEAARVIREAEGYRTELVQRIRGRAKEVEDLVGEFEKAPKLMIARLWADAREEILGSPGVLKFYLPLKSGRAVMRINPDPEMLKKLEAHLRTRKREKDAAEAKAKPTPPSSPPPPPGP